MIPQFIILNTKEIVNRFINFTLSKGETVAFAEVVIEIIFHELDCVETAEYDLRELVARVQFGEYDEDVGFEILECFSLPILDLGLELINTLMKLGLYNSDGELVYRYYPGEQRLMGDLILSHRNYSNQFLIQEEIPSGLFY